MHVVLMHVDRFHGHWHSQVIHTEIQLLMGLKHPNIIHLREIVVDDGRCSSSCLIGSE